VSVVWDGRDRAVLTQFGRRRFGLPALPAQWAGLGFLDPAGEASGLATDPDLDLVRDAVRIQRGVLETKGRGLLERDHEAWDDLRRSQKDFWKTDTHQ